MTVSSAIKSLLNRDSCVQQRQQPSTDDEGFPSQDWQTVSSLSGTWGSPTSVDIETAARLGQIVQAVFASASTARVGDRLINLRGRNWVVTHVRPLLTHNRHFLREG